MNDDDRPLGDILADTVWMRRLARRLVADAAERDEVVQAVWLQALLHAPATQNLRQWLAAVLRNVVRMRFRGEARRERREEQAPATPRPPPTPEELVDVTARISDTFAPAPRIWAVVSGTSFQLRGLAPGQWVVDASGGGGDAAVVRVDAGQVATVTLRDRGSGAIHGRLVEWRSGEPVEGLQCVAMLSAGAIFNRAHGDPGFSGADGSFTIEGAPIGPVTVLCGWAPGYSDGLTNVTVGGAGTSCEVTVVKGRQWMGQLAWFGGEIAVDPTLVVRIISVQPGGPADKAGIKRGDVLSSVDGVSVAHLSPIGDEYAIRDRPPGAHVRLGLVRAGQPVAVDVVVAGSPNE